MIVEEQGRILMSAREFEAFRSAAFAPWVPRTIQEFEAMIDLGIARHLAENTEGRGLTFALALNAIRFEADGTPNFTVDRARLAYMRSHNTWPTHEELVRFVSTRSGSWWTASRTEA